MNVAATTLLTLPAASDQSPLFLIAVGCAAVLLIYVALKLGGMLLKLLFGLIGLALLAAAAWWFLGRH